MEIKRVDDYFMWIIQSKLDRVHPLLQWSSLWPVGLDHTNLWYMHSRRSFPPLKHPWVLKSSDDVKIKRHKGCGSSQVVMTCPELRCEWVNINPLRSNIRIQILQTDLHTFGHSWDSKSYYSFKIFPQFWLAKSTRIIHHNWLLMTKFGRILCLTRKWRKKCSLLQVKAPLPRRPGDKVELFWLWKKKADISLVSRVRTTAGTRWNNG